ncbi:hypothetical protein FEM48_Zijuj03G0119800 [Ziziphus jujuba var. spinosa]|uniref:Uncharacterized protein n=1 Tax=Ziziphus jujuba var. spinosa TaxID=714518 RepID=A0A978VQ67_ZIZJJ|nr:hypothetical protein FEM48_Zijuj03G0119800 [Ziziphus jujuba var. spinosa]
MGMRSLPSQTLYKSGTQPAQTQTNCESEITMEVYLFRTTTSNLHCSSFLSYRTQRPSFLCQSHRPRHVTVPSLSTWRWKVGPSLLQREVDHHRLEGVAVKCEKLGSGYVAELERELQEEINPEEKAEWMRLGRLRENCGGRKGVVELLECLEREAIMGEDQGREPNDYNRRAQIFDKSSRVFQALKERTNVDVDVDAEKLGMALVLVLILSTVMMTST